MVQTNDAFTTTGGPGVIPADAQFTPVEVAHVHLMAGLSRTKPHRIASARADGVDFDKGLPSVQNVLTAVHDYVDAVAHDAADNAPVIIDHVYFPSRVLVSCAEELIGELECCSALFRSAEYRFQGRGA